MEIGNVDQVTLPALGIGAVGVGTLTVIVVMILKRLTGIQGRMAYGVTGLVAFGHAGLALALVAWPAAEIYIGGYVLGLFIWMFAAGLYADAIKGGP